jgi:hypothetical protein
LCNKAVDWTIHGKRASYDAHNVSYIYIHSNSFGRKFTLKFESVVTFVTFVLSTKKYGFMPEEKNDTKLTPARK